MDYTNAVVPYEYLGIPLNKRFILVVSLLDNDDVIFESVIKGLDSPFDELTEDNILVKSFDLRINIEGCVDDTLWVIDTDDTSLPYTFKETLGMLSKDPVYIERLFFFNATDTSDLVIRKVRSIRVYKAGYMWSKVYSTPLSRRKPGTSWHEYFRCHYDMDATSDISDESRVGHRTRMPKFVPDGRYNRINRPYFENMKVVKTGDSIDLGALQRHLPIFKV